MLLKVAAGEGPPLWRRALAEGLGTGLLAAVVVGSGIAAQRLSPHDIGIELLENAVATAAGLAVLILIFGPVSGAHFNPVISLADWLLGRRAGTGLRAAEIFVLCLVGRTDGGRDGSGEGSVSAVVGLDVGVLSSVEGVAGSWAQAVSKQRKNMAAISRVLTLPV